MKTRTKIVLLTAVCTIFAFALGGNTPLGRLIWPAKELQTPPTAVQVPAFVAIGVVEAAAFGLGISFLAYGFASVRRHTRSHSEAVAAYVAVGWMLISWFPHDNLHMFVGEDATGLLALLWGFHATLIAAGLVLASVFIRTAGARAAPSDSHVRAGGPVRVA